MKCIEWLFISLFHSVKQILIVVVVADIVVHLLQLPNNNKYN